VFAARCCGTDCWSTSSSLALITLESTPRMRRAGLQLSQEQPFLGKMTVVVPQQALFTNDRWERSRRVTADVGDRPVAAVR
jgi:hypothetical protein